MPRIVHVRDRACLRLPEGLAARDWIAANVSGMSISPPAVHAGEVTMSTDVAAGSR